MITLEGLGKRFGPMRALDGVSLEVESGGTVAILGPNGSGKSTLLKLVAGLLRPTSGDVKLDGKAPRAVKSRIGYLGHVPHLFPYLSAAENLRFYAAMYRIDSGRSKELLQRVGLSARSDALVRTMSRGETQRLGLARCLLHDPDFLLLDEPLTGLDAAATADFPALVARPGRTILMSTHDPAVVEPLGGRCLSIDAGRLQP